jgi:hypothetical protein
MNKEIIREELQWLLEAINEQFEAVRMYDDKIPRIEFDIMMENVRKLYENMLLLQRLNDPMPGGRIKSFQPAPQMPPQMPPPPIPDPPRQVPQTPAVVIPKAPPAKKPAGPGEMDLFSQAEPAFNIRLKEARETSLGPKVPSARIDNLKSAININDKFMLINDLFEGNLRDYNETIDTLNGCASLDQAAGFLDQVKKKFLWDTGSPAFAKLKELVERRF